MTLWNPLNVFSNPERKNAAVPSASFDPSSTGDPLGPGVRPSIGFGTTWGDGRSGVSDPQRRPIGFAPPEEDRSEPSYRTELSFKRHTSPPRASATHGPSGADEPDAWQTPDAGSADESPLDAVAGTTTADADDSVESVPFYKREFSFGRKRSRPAAVTPVPNDAPELALSPVEEQQVAPVEEAQIAALDASIVAAAVAEPDADEPSEAVVEAEEVDVVPTEASVPFYRREISLRRKSGAPSSESEGAAAALVAAAVETVVESAQTDDIVEAGLDPASVAQADEPEVVAEAGNPHLDSDNHSDSDTHDAEPSASAEADAVTGLEFAASDPVADAEQDAPVADVGPDEEPAAEAPAAPEGRTSRRKSKGTPNRRGRSSRGRKGRTVVGLKIGASQIAAAEINETDEGRELVRLARRPLAAGIVVDGEVRDHDALAVALKAFFDEEKLPRNDVRIGVSSNRIGVRTFDLLGAADEKQLDNAVRFKAHELLPVAVSESVLDYRVLDERPSAEGETMRRVLLVVAPRDQVEPYARAANEAGLKLAGIDLEALALLRAFVEPKRASAGAVADTATVVVAIGHESSTLLVAGGSACEFTRVFDWGGGELEQAIASTLEVDLDEAAVILKHLSLSGPGLMLEALDDEKRARAVDAIRHRLTPFARELVNSLQFYQTQAESLGIGGIVVTGGTSHLEGLEGALQQMIGVDVEIGDPLTRVTPTGDVDPVIEAMIGSMAVPIGLAIDDAATRSVNLIPGDAVRQKSTRKTALTIATPVAIAVPLVALGFLYVGARGSASDSQTQLDAVAAEIASLPTPAAPRIDASVVGDEAVRATAVASVLGGRVAWDAVFRDLSRVLPTNVWLQTLSVALPDSGDPATAIPVAAPLPGQAPAAPSAVKLDGFTYDQPDVARLLARLAVLPTLERVTLVSSEQSEIGDKPVVHFVIVADLKKAGGAS